MSPFMLQSSKTLYGTVQDVDLGLSSRGGEGGGYWD